VSSLAGNLISNTTEGVRFEVRSTRVASRREHGTHSQRRRRAAATGD
jgi:hypothetical protein